MSRIKLTEEQKALLFGEKGNSYSKCMKILVTLGEIFGAKKLIKVSSVQISGVSYANIGKYGLEFIEDLAKDGVKVSIKTTLNPAGMDLIHWREMGIDKEFAEKQKRVISAFEKIGVEISCSCIPYLIGNLPKRGEHIAWGESSAVCYANSVIGARTNREGGPSTIASSITGYTPEYGLHLEENRIPYLKVILDIKEIKPLYPGIIGYILGEKLKNKIPYIIGPKIELEGLKELSASIATYSGISMFYWKGISEEIDPPKKELILRERDIKEGMRWLKGDKSNIDLIAIGCPHATLNELYLIKEILKGRKVKIETWISTARKIYELALKKGLIDELGRSGVKIFCDSCFVVAPIKGRFKKIGTDSAKALYYIKGRLGSETYYGEKEELLEIAIKGS